MFSIFSILSDASSVETDCDTANCCQLFSSIVIMAVKNGLASPMTMICSNNGSLRSEERRVGKEC